MCRWETQAEKAFRLLTVCGTSKCQASFRWPSLQTTSSDLELHSMHISGMTLYLYQNPWNRTSKDENVEN